MRRTGIPYGTYGEKKDALSHTQEDRSSESGDHARCMIMHLHCLSLYVWLRNAHSTAVCMDESVTLTLPCYFGKYYPWHPIVSSVEYLCKTSCCRGGRGGRGQHSITSIGAIYHIIPRRVSTCRIILSIARAKTSLFSAWLSPDPNPLFLLRETYVCRDRVSRITTGTQRVYRIIKPKSESGYLFLWQ